MLFYRIAIVAFACSVVLSSCVKHSDTVVTPTDSTTKQPQDTIYHPVYGALQSDSSFSAGKSLGTLDPAKLTEASGLAASRKYPGFFWTHNDSKNPNWVYLLDSTGKIRVIVKLPFAYGNRDWEDIAVAPGPTSGLSYIYVGEIGDNDVQDPSYHVYRFPEPDFTIADSLVTITIASVDNIFFKYPDASHNAETLMVDPLTKDIYVVTKFTFGVVFVAKYPQPLDSLFTVKEVAILPLSTLTAGDISSDGTEILMKNYNQVYYWKRNAGEKIAETLNRTPLLLPYIIEAQGEAICWSVSGDAYYTTSEYTNNIVAPLYQYKRK
jgi:hypothetical protein